jgi:hypothetical protein
MGPDDRGGRTQNKENAAIEKSFESFHVVNSPLSVAKIVNECSRKTITKATRHGELQLRVW